jgi:hypothetical protein
MTQEALIQLLLEILVSYGRQFGIPASEEDLRAIAGAILSFQQKQGHLAIAPEAVEPLIQQVVGQFQPQQVATAPTDAETVILAQQVQQWRDSLASQVLDSLNAYVQQLPLEPTNLDLQDIILAIIPLVEEMPLSQTEVKSLVQRVASEFNWQIALAQIISPNGLAIAQRLVGFLQHGDLATTLQEQVLSYLQQFAPKLKTITETLVEQVLANMLGGQTQVQIKTDISLEDQQLLVKQVSLKLNLMEEDAPPGKTAQEIADQVDQEIDRFKTERAKTQVAKRSIQTASLAAPKAGKSNQKSRRGKTTG